jgi:hypothetical protein
MNTTIAFRAAAAAALAAGLAGCGHDHCWDCGPPQLALQALTQQSTVGSTTDPSGQGLNPYGLAIDWTSNGLVEQGDLIACNFNDAANAQGTGTTVVDLHPNVGASPILIANSPELLGCSSLTTLPDGNIVAASSQANALVLVSPTAVNTLSTPYSSDTFYNPWSVIFADEPHNVSALYVSNSTKGTIDRIVLNSDDSQSSFTEIATGFTVSGSPGSILAPSGLTYDDSIDTLYVVDSANNAVLAFNNVSTIGADGVQVSVSGSTDSFSGANAGNVQVIASGAPLNGPISAALLPSGNLIVGNTLDASSTNLMLEIQPGGPGAGVVYTRNVDTGAAGALFGITIGFDNYGNPVIFYNDDNTNTVDALSY